MAIEAPPGRNWSGSYAFRAERLHRPRSVAELQEVIAGARRARVVGTTHSFSGIADSEDLITLTGLPQLVEVNRDAATARIPAALTYAEAASALAGHGLALHNLASLPHVSVGGAIATATHGSGDRKGNLATAVRGLDLVTGEGELLHLDEADPDFAGAVVHLGALGAVTAVTLAVEPTYDVGQRVYEGLSWEAVDEYFPEIMAAGDSVSLFPTWGPEVEQVWVKTRVGGDGAPPPDDLFGARCATEHRHPIAGFDPGDCSEQLGVPGSWAERLPHFRSGFRASAGEEMQTELHLPREHARAAITAVRALADVVRPLLLVSEIRTVAADDLWMSPMYQRDTVCVHFTWRLDPEPVMRATAAIEEALAPFDPRPHWGKLFTRPARHERAPDFLALVDRLDPRGVFRNDWFEANVRI